MRKGIVAAFLAVLVWACWGLAPNGPTAAAPALPPSDPRLPMPPMPPVPEPPPSAEPAPKPPAPVTSPKPEARATPAKPGVSPEKMFPQPIQVPHPYLQLPPLPPVPPTLPLPESLKDKLPPPDAPAQPAAELPPVTIPTPPPEAPAPSLQLPPATSEAPPPVESPNVTDQGGGKVIPGVMRARVMTRTTNAPGQSPPDPGVIPPPAPVGSGAKNPGDLPSVLQNGGEVIRHQTVSRPAPEGPPPPFWDPNARPVYPSGTAADCGCDGPRFWASADYLLWFYRSAGLPPLVASVPAAAARQRFDPRTATILSPADGINDGPGSGARGTAGMWLNETQTVGVEGTYFWLPEQETSATIGPPGGGILGRPFFNVLSGNPAFLPLSLPGLVDGSSTIESSVELHGGELNLLGRGYSVFSDRVELLAGFRYLGLRESLRVTDRWAAVGGIDARLTAVDEFATGNDFYGGQVGVRFNYVDPRWAANLAAKVAYGALNQGVSIDGGTRARLPGLPEASAPGGVLTGPTNIGDHSRTRGAWLPELTFNLGYRVTPRCLAFVGYNYLYVTDVLRPGGQIDTGVNPDLLPLNPVAGASRVPRPGVLLRGEDFWAQGLNFGVSLTY